MKIPLSIVATDVISGESVHFTEGEIAPALRASCAYPGLFLPVEYRGRMLVDGFLTETVPAPAAREMGAEIVISVHLEPGLLDRKSAQHHRSDQPLVFHHSSVRYPALARGDRRAHRAGRASRAVG